VGPATRVRGEREREIEDVGSIAGGSLARRPRRPPAKGWMDASQYGKNLRTGSLGEGGRRESRCSSPEAVVERLVRVRIFGEVEELQHHRFDQEGATSTPERLGEVEEHWKEWNTEGDP
jgi:hypothetical protein